jgi:hypothetical protein
MPSGNNDENFEYTPLSPVDFIESDVRISLIFDEVFADSPNDFIISIDGHNTYMLIS